MKPFVICSPRTGSSLFTHVLYSLCQKNWGYKSNLGEYFSEYTLPFEKPGVDISTVLPYYYRVIDGTLFKLTRDENFSPEIVLGGTENKIKVLSQLDDVHLIKAHTVDLKEPALEFIQQKKYDIFYLERRNKLEQFLSFLTGWQYHRWYYKPNDAPVSRIIYSRQIFSRFFRYLRTWYEQRRTYQFGGWNIFYEDFMSAGANQQAILTLTGIQAEINNEPVPWKFVSTKYSASVENLIVNRHEYENDKAFILEQLCRLENDYN